MMELPEEFRRLPGGLGQSLARDLEAMSRFDRLDRDTQQKIIRYVQTGATGSETQDRVRQAVDLIKSGGSWGFWS